MRRGMLFAAPCGPAQRKALFRARQTTNPRKASPALTFRNVHRAPPARRGGAVIASNGSAGVGCSPAATLNRLPPQLPLAARRDGPLADTRSNERRVTPNRRSEEPPRVRVAVTLDLRQRTLTPATAVELPVFSSVKRHSCASGVASGSRTSPPGVLSAYPVAVQLRPQPMRTNLVAPGASRIPEVFLV